MNETDPIVNINVGVLGHVDSGKTSLVGALSTTLSTAALDKDPQSKERGITLDLGFSSFILPSPTHISPTSNYKEIQFTLVDCPGHSSLLKTIIGGAQIIDFMLLVIDATKLVQAQTDECIVLGEAVLKSNEQIIVVLNKIDLFPKTRLKQCILDAERELKSHFKGTKFEHANIVPISATSAKIEKDLEPLDDGIENLKNVLCSQIQIPQRKASGSFFLSVDHCFPLKGKGTVLTGTVLDGTVQTGQSIELPDLKIVRRVKSIQAFRRPIKSASKGERIGICVSKLPSELVERGVVCAPNALLPVHKALCLAKGIESFRGKCSNGSKIHISTGHTTVMGTVHFFGFEEISHLPKLTESNFPSEDLEFEMDWEREYKNQTSLVQQNNSIQFLLVQFQSPIFCLKRAHILGYKLEQSTNRSKPGKSLSDSRICFCGRIIETLDKNVSPKSVKMYVVGERKGSVHKANGKIGEICVKNMFGGAKNIERYIGCFVKTRNGQIGKITRTFGTSGKFIAKFPFKVNVEEGEEVYFPFKRYMHDKSRTMNQLDLKREYQRSSCSDDLDCSSFGCTLKERTECEKERSGKIDSLRGEPMENGQFSTVIVKDMFKIHENTREYLEREVVSGNGEVGKIVGPFGKAGKCKVYFESGTACVPDDMVWLLAE